MAVKWTDQLVLAVIAEARKSGFVAARRKLAELQGDGARYNVTDGANVVDTMLDVCGFANLKISARGKFFQIAKRMSNNLNGDGCRFQRFLCCIAYRGGGSLSIFDSTMRQEMSVNIAACEGQAVVLRGYGIECSIESRID